MRWSARRGGALAASRRDGVVTVAARVTGVAALLAALLVHDRFPWVPWWYLGIVVGVPAAGRWAFRRAAGRRVRAATASTVLSVLVLASPVPWQVATGDDPPGNAWRLDGRITIDGRTVDPEGDWYWLTVGRPATVAEVLLARVARSADERPTSMRSGPLRQRARWSEPAAAAIGLARGGWGIETRWELHAAGPRVDGLPVDVVVMAIDGAPPARPTRGGRPVPVLAAGRHTMTTSSGASLEFDGRALPYERVEWLLVPADDVEVVVGGWLASTPAGRWYRNLSSGASHGLMVALVAYTHASGDELGRGLSIAGTGTIRADGSVGRVRGLPAKAEAARDAGVDVFLYPAGQEGELDRLTPGGMQTFAVHDLDGAIAALRAAR